MPRLIDLAVEGRQPEIRGMPELGEVDADATVKAVLAMRGTDKKKHKQAWEEGFLKLAAKKLPMQGKVQAWRDACGHGET